MLIALLVITYFHVCHLKVNKVNKLYNLLFGM